MKNREKVSDTCDCVEIKTYLFRTPSLDKTVIFHHHSSCTSISIPLF